MAKHPSLNIPTSIVISGVESNTYFDIVVRKSGFRFVLMSYHYLQGKPKNFLKERLEEFPDLKVFIDSGAHTFYQKMDEYRQKDEKFWDEYLTKYTEWVKENSEYIFACANLDIEAIVGVDTVDKWNDKYFKPLEESGIEVCYIWHSERGQDGWREMCRKHSYVGLSYENDAQMTVQRLMSMVNVAKKTNTRVHGMALTQTEILARVPLFSADSSVDGSSKVLVRYKTKNPTVPYKMEQLSIKELYDRNINWEFRTSDFETRVPYKDVEVLTVDNNNNTVWGNLYGVVKHIVKKPTIKLKVQGGKEVICTTDHSIITMDSEGNLIETKADKLKVGDYVLSTKVENAFRDNNHKNSLWDKGFQFKLTDNALQVYGLWIGDGHINDEYIGFSCFNDEECVKPIKSFIDRCGKDIKYSSENTVDGRIYSVELVERFKKLGLVGHSHTKRVPKWVYSLSEYQIGQFLKGYFSAGGTAPCEISTVSEHLKDDLVCLLEMMGIYTSVTYYPSSTFIKDGKEYNAREHWKITVKDINSLIKFRDKIGFLQKHKMDSLNKYIESKEPRQSRREEKPNYINADVNGVTFLKIKDIEQITDGTEEVEVYDLSVEKYERFFANGILVHNTTWLVGQQYGELNWFDGRKMRRLSKDQWMRQYKTQLLQEPFNADWELLTTGMGGKGDTYELLRLNVIAYKLAEEHIRKRLKNKMYWLPKEDEAVEVVEVDSLETPPYEWFDGECDDWQQYLMKLRIMPSGYTKDEAVDLLYFFYIFLNEDYKALKEDFEEQEIIDYAKAVISESIEDYESAVEALRDYFVKNATGERNDLRGEDDMDEELGIARPKEREVYIEEDAFEIIDLSEEQIEKKLQLPPPKDNSMPEVEAYDEELARNNIVAVRDEKGRFLKGQQKVRKPKNIYSQKYPKLNCDTCYKSGDCPEYMPGYVCAFDKMFKRFDTRNAEDVIDAMCSMVNHNLERLQRAMMFEIMDGGMATPEVTALIDQNAKLLEKLQQIRQLSAQTILQQRRTIMADGTETIENSMSVNPSSGGILSQIFGGLSKSTKDEDINSPKKKAEFEEVIEVEYEDEE